MPAAAAPPWTEYDPSTETAIHPAGGGGHGVGVSSLDFEMTGLGAIVVNLTFRISSVE